MGMYDDITLWCSCPYCGSTMDLKAQTHELTNNLAQYHALPNYQICYINGSFDKEIENEKDPERKKKLECCRTLFGDKERLDRYKLPPQFKDLKGVKAYATCNSISCQFDADRDWLMRQSCPSGFGRGFDVFIPIVNGMLISRLDNVKLDDFTEEKWTTFLNADTEKSTVVRATIKLAMKQPWSKGQLTIILRNWHKAQLGYEGFLVTLLK